MHDSQWKKVIFVQGFSFPRIYFLRDFFPEILFPETLLAAPILFQEKKSQESKTQDFISSDIFSKDLRKFGLFFQSFYFQVFFPEIFFPMTFLHRFLSITLISLVMWPQRPAPQPVLVAAQNRLEGKANYSHVIHMRCVYEIDKGGGGRLIALSKEKPQT